MSPPPSRLVRTVLPGKPAGATFFEWGQKAPKCTGFSGNFVRASPRGTICTKSLPASNAGAEEAEETHGVMNLSLRDRVRLHQDRAPKFLSPRAQPRAVARDRGRFEHSACTRQAGGNGRAAAQEQTPARHKKCAPHEHASPPRRWRSRTSLSMPRSAGPGTGPRRHPRSRRSSSRRRPST